MTACRVMGALPTPKLLDAKFLGKYSVSPGSLGGSAFCSVSPARCAGSSFTYAERSTTQALPYDFRVRELSP